ncbi:zinc-ribbon domain-containing protein [Streptomyces sp. NPDC046182]|uniref:zinc-ribbon domain-containing protein n=1 Tax=Streptomyces sp. NPDC046182 TaxID=3154601 RepID=UPI0033D85BD0
MKTPTLLRDTHQEIFAEALEMVGGPMHPLSELTTGSNRRVRWRCRTCEHEWASTVTSRLPGGSARSVPGLYGAPAEPEPPRVGRSRTCFL